MPRDPKYDVLFEPIKIGPKTLPNRFYQVAHCMGAGSEKPGFQASFRGMKAEGGWGAVTTEFCSISPESDETERVSARLWDDGDVRNLGLMCDKVHEHGALAAVELFHGGVGSSNLESRSVARGPSQMAIKPFSLLATNREMTKRDIAEVRQAYVDAALRAVDAGFDILTVYVAHTATVLHQFLLPFFNRRTDEYGGSFENRARFSREVTESIREAVGDRCAISIRFGIYMFEPPIGLGDMGIRPEEDGLRFIEHLDDLVDFWDINAGGEEDSAPSRTSPENFHAPYTLKVKQHTSKPVLNVGRFTNPDTMVQVIRDGQCDIIGAARPSIADPFLPAKIRDGKLDEIRECIGCNICWSRWQIGGPPIQCTQNPTSGEEFRRGWHPERFEKAGNADSDVLVVGAGPAGMECAVVLAKREMRRVHLVDAGSEIGGHVRWVSQLPGLGEWGRVINYREIQLAKQRKRVEVIRGLDLDAGAIRDYGAEIVVIATGSHWARDGVQGITGEAIPGADAALSHIATPEQIMVEGKELGERVLVYDCDGYYMGLSIAEKLAREGKDVTYVTPYEEAGSYMHYTLELFRIKPVLAELGVKLRVEETLIHVSDTTATVEEKWTSAREELPVDGVVLVTQRISDDTLYRELEDDVAALDDAGIVGVYRIGDCVAPGLIADATFSGHRLAREIDSSDPARPLPYIRERRLVGGTDADYVLPVAVGGRS